MTRSVRALPLPGRNLIAANLVLCTAACSNDAGTILAPASSMSPPAEASSLTVATFANPIAGAAFFVDPYSNAKKTAAAWKATRPADALQMQKLAAQPGARWIGNWNTNVLADVNAATTTMSAAGAVPVFVAYNIPQRDCGGLSGGNSTSADQYRQWIRDFATGIGARKAVVVLEPDALAAMDCLSATDQALRLSLVQYAVETFKTKGSISVYIDAGHPRWKSASTISKRLISAGIASATGFSLNVSNFLQTSDNVATQWSYR